MSVNVCVFVSLCVCVYLDSCTINANGNVNVQIVKSTCCCSCCAQMLTEYQITLDSHAVRVCGIVYSPYVCVSLGFIFIQISAACCLFSKQ